MDPKERQLQLFALTASELATDGGVAQCIVCRSVHMLHRHHCDGDRRNNGPDNIVLLCERCHVELHRGGWGALDRDALLALRAEVDRRRQESGDQSAASV